MKHLIPAETNRRILAFRKGTRAEEIAYKCGVSHTYVYKLRKAHGLTEKKVRFSRATIKKIISMRDDGVRIVDILEECKMSRPTLYAILRREGYPITQYKPRGPQTPTPPKLAPWVVAELEKLKQK